MEHYVSPDEKCRKIMKQFSQKKLKWNQIKPIEPITNLEEIWKTEEQVKYTQRENQHDID